MCEFFLREYSFSLLSHQSLWQVAMDYLGHCPSKGRHCMSLLVQSIPLTTDKKAKKVLSLCKRYQLNDQGEIDAIIYSSLFLYLFFFFLISKLKIYVKYLL